MRASGRCEPAAVVDLRGWEWPQSVRLAGTFLRVWVGVPCDGVHASSRAACVCVSQDLDVCV